MNKRLLKKQLNHFYSCLALEDKTYENCHITMADLGNKECLAEILYDLNDNYFTYEGTSTLCRKVEHLLHRHNKIDTISKMIIGVGLAIMIGTVGAGDLNTISYAQIVAQSLISISIMGIGFILYKRGVM